MRERSSESRGMTDTVCYREENQIGIVQINRLAALNALNTQVLAELEVLFEQIEQGSAKCILLTGAGSRAFAAGADIQEMNEFTVQEAVDFSTLGNRVLQKIERCPVPVIAVVNGYALGGGCELAMSCDFILCSETAVFAQPETGLGIIPGFGGTQRLVRLVGLAKAKELIYTGRRMDAAEAYRAGLVLAVYPQEQLMEQAISVAERICANGSTAIRKSKEAIHAELDQWMEEGSAQEAISFGACFADSDQRRRMADFLNKKR